MAKKSKTAEKERIWHKRRMKLYKVDDGGDLDHPKAYLGLEVEMSQEEFRTRGLDGINHVGIDRGKAVDLEICTVGYGDGFTIQVALGVSDPDQEKMFTPAVIVTKVEAEKIASASLKDQTLKHSILIPLKTWVDFGQLREYVGQMVEVTIIKGTITGEGQATIE